MLERIFGVTQQQVSEYVKVGMPVSSRGKYDLEACVTWWVARKRAEIDSQLENLGWKEQEVRLKRAKADREEMEAAKMRGTLIEREVVLRQYGQLVSAFRARVLRIGSTVAPRAIGCTAAQMKQMIDDEVWDALSELSRGEDVPRGTQTDSSSPTTAHGVRMGGRKPRPKSRKRIRAGAVAD